MKLLDIWSDHSVLNPQVVWICTQWLLYDDLMSCYKKKKKKIWVEYVKKAFLKAANIFPEICDPKDIVETSFVEYLVWFGF